MRDPDLFCTVYKRADGYVLRLPSGRAVAAATDALYANRRDEEKVIPDEDLMAMEVHGRCRFMWDTSSFQRDAPRDWLLGRCLYDQISGHVKNNGYFTDAAYIGYSMYAEGPVFLKCKRLGIFDLANDMYSGRLDELDDELDEQEEFVRGISECYLEPGGQRVGMAVVPHYDAVTTANLAALHTWASGSSAEEVFGNAAPFGYVVQQAHKNAMDLAEGRSLVPVTRFYALNFQQLPKDTVIEEQLMVPDEAEGPNNPYLTDLVCDATLLSRGCGNKTSGYVYHVPCTAVLEYPDLLLKMLRDFAQKYTKDRLTDRGLLLATHLWVNITDDPDLELEVFAKQQRAEGMPYQRVPTISLAQCLIYYPHWLRWVANMGLVEFIHPFRFIRKAVETDVANNPNAGMEVEADDIEEDQVRELMGQVRSASPDVMPQNRNPYFPFLLPGSKLPPLYGIDPHYYYTDFTTALSGLENVRFLGLPTYAPPRVPEGTQPDPTFVLVQPNWATTKVVCQNCVVPYLDYTKENPWYPGYGLAKRWVRPTWRDMPVSIRTSWQWW